MMIIYWIIGIALIAWIVREITRRHNSSGEEQPAHDKNEHKKDPTCCH